MKKIIFIITIMSSFSAIATSCPEINGIFACTGISKSDQGKIVSVKSEVTQDGRGQLLFNSEVYLTEGKSGVFCNNFSYRDEGRQIIKRDEDTFNQIFRVKVSSEITHTYQSACVRLRAN
jgi:hypothetical protein